MFPGPSRYVPLFGGRRYRPEHERPAVNFDEQVGGVGGWVGGGMGRVLVKKDLTTKEIVSGAVAASALGGRTAVRSSQ